MRNIVRGGRADWRGAASAWSKRAVALAASALAALGAVGSGGCGSGRVREPELTAQTRELAVASFDEVWTTVRDQHWDPSLGGVDWNGVKAELRPRVESATTMEEARQAMSEALERLGQSHYGIIPASAYEGEEGGASPGAGSGGSVGIDLRVLGGQAIVWRVSAGTPADRAGVRPGWRVVKVGRAEMDRVIDAVMAAQEGATEAGFYAAMTCDSFLRGSVGETRRVTFEPAPGARARTITLDLEPNLGGVVANFGNLPPVRLEYSARRLSSGAGYVTFNIFLEPGVLMPWFAEQLKAFADAPGLVIDLRGNPGGLGAMAMGLGGWFVEESNLKLGTMTTRQGAIRFVLNPRAEGFRGALAILIDESSVSTSEIMAGGLQAIGRARVFGVRSAGAALPSVVSRLPNGDGFQFARADYVSADGARLEGAGVAPDEVVELTRGALLEGRDPVLEAAERWILGQRPSGG